MVLSSTDLGNVKSITDMILVELSKAGLTSSKMLSQVYDGASVLARHCGGVQRLLQERENKDSLCAPREPSIAPLVVHAMSDVQAINDFLHVCGSLYNLFRNPTVVFHYKKEKLKRLLEQR